MKQLRSLLVICTLATFPANGQSYSVPQAPARIAYAPKSFYIAQVVDDRANSASIGTIKTSKKEQLYFQGGTEKWMETFVTANLSANKTGQPITLHIVELDVDIKQKGRGWQVSSSINLAFYAGDKKIVGYSGKSEGETAKPPEIYIAEFISHSLEADIKKFDQWWQQNGSRIPLSQDVKLNVVVATTTDKPNHIVYTRSRMLQIADFKGPPENSLLELAATYSGISLGYAEHVINGETTVDVTITPFFDVSKSWFKPEGKTPAVLAHEQAHFDITAIKACELANALRKARLTRDNFATVIEQLQSENTQATSDEEELYDAETNHGIIKDKQAAWERKVTEQARTVGCY